MNSETLTFYVCNVSKWAVIEQSVDHTWRVINQRIVSLLVCTIETQMNTAVPIMPPFHSIYMKILCEHY